LPSSLTSWRARRARRCCSNCCRNCWIEGRSARPTWPGYCPLYSASFQGPVGFLLRERATLWLSDGRRFDAQELYGLLPLATLTHFKAGLASEIPHVVMRLLASASPAVQAANVEQLWSYGNGTPWASTLTCAFMGALGPDALAKLVAELLPFLGSKSLFSRKVRAFIAEGITGGLDV
jgi:hypothetical protein